MTSDPLPDDSLWSSLAQELGLDSAPAPTPKHEPRSSAPQPTPIEVNPVEQLSGHLMELPDASEDEDTSLEPALSGEAIADGEGGEEESGEGGKRRRRRRRRRRKGGPDENAETTTEATGDEQEGFDDEEPTSEVKAPDALRDVIANWNVPAWEDLVGGLYRPGS